jgi:hypothetical protein
LKGWTAGPKHREREEIKKKLNGFQLQSGVLLSTCSTRYEGHAETNWMPPRNQQHTLFEDGGAVDACSVYLFLKNTLNLLKY